MTKTKYNKHKIHGFVYGEEIRTPLVRFAWPYLVTPRPAMKPKDGQKPGQPRYEITAILDNNPENIAFLKKVKAMVNEMLPIYNEGKPAKITIDKFITDGNDFDAEKYPYYQDKFVLVARNQKEVEIFGRKREKLGADQVLGGMHGVLLVTPLLTAHGVSYKLGAVQVVSDDGVRIGGFTRDTKKQLVDWDEESGHMTLDNTGIEDDSQTTEEPPVAAAPKKGKNKALDLL